MAEWSGACRWRFVRYVVSIYFLLFFAFSDLLSFSEVSLLRFLLLAPLPLSSSSESGTYVPTILLAGPVRAEDRVSSVTNQRVAGGSTVQRQREGRLRCTSDHDGCVRDFSQNVTLPVLAFLTV